MTTSDAGQPENRFEKATTFAEAMDLIRKRMEPDLRKIATQLRMREFDVMCLAVVTLAQQLELTEPSDSLVLLVHGTVTPFNTGLEAMLATAPDDEFAPIVAYLQGTDPTE